MRIDCRRMCNPHSNLEMRALNGQDPAVQAFVKKDPLFGTLFKHACEQAIERGEIAFGCYGGRHRSVAMAEIVAAFLRCGQHEVVVEHRDIDR